MTTANGAVECLSSIKAFAAAQLRREYQWLKTEAMDAMLERALSELKVSLAQQEGAMQASKKRMGFMKLSAELRNRIYELALVSGAEDADAVQILRQPVGPDARLRVPALLQTSSQVRGEAIPIYYGQNTFSIITTSPRENCAEINVIGSWLQSIGRRSRAEIKEIVTTVFGFWWDSDMCLRRVGQDSVQLVGRKTSGAGADHERVRVIAQIDRAGVEWEKWKLQIWGIRDQQKAVLIKGVQ